MFASLSPSLVVTFFNNLFRRRYNVFE
jgi:hypothetical protein